MVATGGTLFGNALSMAAARATMLEVLTAEAYASTQRLGARLADGMRATSRGSGCRGRSISSDRAAGTPSARRRSAPPTRRVRAPTSR